MSEMPSAFLKRLRVNLFLVTRRRIPYPPSFKRVLSYLLVSFLLYVAFFIVPVFIQIYTISLQTETPGNEISETMLQAIDHPLRNVTHHSRVKAKRIPKILHRTWKTRDLKSMPKKWKKAYRRCSTIYDQFHYKTILWTDESTRDFISNHYSWFLSQYESYPYNIQRVDAARYFILYHYGGIYQDLDIKCKQSMEIIRRTMSFNRKEVLIPRTRPVGFSNDIMISTPGNAFFLRLIDTLPSSNKWYGTPYLTVIFSTGPMFLSKVYHMMSAEAKSVIAILPQDMYSTRTNNTRIRFFTHLRGSSWHTTDGFLLTFLQKHVIIVLVFGVIILYMKSVSQRKKKLFEKDQDK